MGNSSSKPRPESPSRKRLIEIRERLLNLHKALIDFERERYEKTVGPIPSPSQFLQLLTRDPWFAWLQPLSHLIVAMDVALKEKEPLTAAGVDRLASQTRALLVAEENGESFSGHYFEALQNEPDVVLAHGAAIRVMGRGPAAKATKPGAGEGKKSEPGSGAD
jgi:hypothetical protein